MIQKWRKDDGSPVSESSRQPIYFKHQNQITMTETKQFVDSLFSTAAQAVESFADGVQFTDVTDFVDEGMSWGAAITGLQEGFPKEAKEATPEAIENVFEPQRKKLNDAGVNPLLTGAIVSNLKGIYYTYAAIVQSSQSVVERKKAA